MFDAVLTGGNAPKRRFGQSFVVTVVANIALAGFVGYLSTRPAKVVKQVQEVKFVARQYAPPPPPPPPPPPAGGAKPKVEQKKPKPVKKPDTFVDNKNKDDKNDPPKEPETPDDDGNGNADGVPGGVDGGVSGGTPGGTGTGPVPPAPPPPPPTTMQYDSGGMSPITLVGGTAHPSYTREAREARVEGKVIARCVITETGMLEGCRIVKGLPHLDEAVLANLRARRYAPIMYQGRPVRVYYTIPFTFKLQ
jgi:periplasmic protein TonB